MLKSFLQTLLSKDNNTSTRTNQLVKLIGQDILFSTSHGQIRTVKHLQLGLITKRKTVSREMRTYLNRLWHTMSYIEVNRFAMSKAEAKLQLQCLHSFVLNIVVTSTFVTFVLDNCDHNPESLSSASMHCTNGIIIQRQDNKICVINWSNVHESVLTGPSWHTSFQPVLSETMP